MPDPRPESMADVMADAMADTARLLLEQADWIVSHRDDGPPNCHEHVEVIARLAASMRYWRDACHAADARIDQLRAELDQARWRPYTYNLNHPEDPT